MQWNVTRVTAHLKSEVEGFFFLISKKTYQERTHGVLMDDDDDDDDDDHQHQHLCLGTSLSDHPHAIHEKMSRRKIRKKFSEANLKKTSPHPGMRHWYLL